VGDRRQSLASTRGSPSNHARAPTCGAFVILSRDPKRHRINRLGDRGSVTKDWGGLKACRGPALTGSRLCHRTGVGGTSAKNLALDRIVSSTWSCRRCIDHCMLITVVWADFIRPPLPHDLRPSEAVSSEGRRDHRPSSDYRTRSCECTDYGRSMATKSRLTPRNFAARLCFEKFKLSSLDAAPTSFAKYHNPILYFPSHK
jgi:hypothetical protein